MADAYTAPVNQILDSIVKNEGNSSSSAGLQRALENVLSKLPKGQDGNELQVQTVVAGEVSTAPVVFADASKGFNIGNVSGASVVNFSGSGSVSGTANSAQDQLVILGATSGKIGLTGEGGATVQAGSGDTQLTVGKAGPSSIVAGSGDLTVNAIGTGSVSADLTATSNATVSAGGGDDTATLGRGSYNLNLGSGRNTVTTTQAQAARSSGDAPPASQAPSAHDGYKVSVDGSNRIVLDDGQGHVSTLANVNVVQFSNGSTFVKASTADEAAIARMYEAVLDRTADSAGIYGWWDAYNSGKLSLRQVGDAFLNSAEAQARGFGSSVDTTTFVSKLYQNLLERVPDAAGLKSWVDAINSGAISRVDALVQFTSSAEGAVTNADSVLLSTVSGAGRDHTPRNFDIIPDGSQTVAGGAGYDVVNFGGNRSDFTTHLDLDRVTVFNANTATTTTLDHVEYVRFGDGSVMINAANTEQAVIARMYDAVMNRSADAAGLQHWWGASESGASLQDIAHAFLTSPEFQATSGNLSNSAFVEQLYQNMFGRTGDQAGHDYWNGQLANGMSREDLVVNIAKSLEAAQDTADTIKIIDHTHHY